MVMKRIVDQESNENETIEHVMTEICLKFQVEIRQMIEK